jgi:hypothetical protein
MTTPATPTRKRTAKAAAPTPDVVETPKPARKPRAVKPAPLGELIVLPTAEAVADAVETSKRTRKPAAVEPTPVVETTPEPKPAKPSFAETPEATELLVLHEAMTSATTQFELTIVELISAGVSPSAISTATGIPTSSVRRIAKRRSPGSVK